MTDVLDLTGLRCPLPALKTRRRLRAMPAGGRVVVKADDPLAAIDVPHAAREEGARVIEQRREVEGERPVSTFLIEAGSGAPDRR